ALNKKYDFQLKKPKVIVPNSDHASFYRKKVPVVFFFTGFHPDYHKPSDTADKINVAGMGKVADLSEEVLRELAGSAPRPEYQQVQIMSFGGGRGGFPRLEFTPGDYAETEKGVLVAEVKK